MEIAAKLKVPPNMWRVLSQEERAALPWCTRHWHGTGEVHAARAAVRHGEALTVAGSPRLQPKQRPDSAGGCWPLRHSSLASLPQAQGTGRAHGRRGWAGQLRGGELAKVRTAPLFPAFAKRS